MKEESVGPNILWPEVFSSQEASAAREMVLLCKKSSEGEKGKLGRMDF